MPASPLFSTCDLCDANAGEPSLRVLPPVFRAYGARQHFCGPVATVKCFEDNSLVRATLEQAGQGRVLVVDGGASLRRALMGGKLGALAVAQGWAGVLIDGCVRDVAELAVCDVGIRALGAVPMPPDKRNAGQTDVPVQVQGQWLRPGDWLYADADGVIVASRSLHSA